MKPAPLIPDWLPTTVGQEIEFGRTPEFTFRPQALGDVEIKQKLEGQVKYSPDRVLHHVEKPLEYPADVCARIFTLHEFGRQEAVKRAMERVGFRPALFCEGDSLARSDRFLRTIDYRSFIPLCCLGTSIVFKGDVEYIPYLTFWRESEDLLIWTVDSPQIVLRGYSFLGIKL